MYHYRARAYDPEAGRFLQRDPLGYVDGLGLYEFCATSPATWRDPLGERLVVPEGRDFKDAEQDEDGVVSGKPTGKVDEKAREAIEGIAKLAGATAKFEENENGDGYVVTFEKDKEEGPYKISEFLWYVLNYITSSGLDVELGIVDGSHCSGRPGMPMVGSDFEGWEFVWRTIHELLHSYVWLCVRDQYAASAGDQAYAEAKKNGASDQDALKAKEAAEEGAQKEADKAGKDVAKTEEGFNGAVDLENAIREEVGAGSRPSHRSGGKFRGPAKK